MSVLGRVATDRRPNAGLIVRAAALVVALWFDFELDWQLPITLAIALLGLSLLESIWDYINRPPG